MNLVIVESPSKAKTIQKYLGSEFKVVASGGHISDLPKRVLGIDIKNNFKPEYEIVDSKKKDLIKEFKDLVKKSNNIYIATDPDREGEAIAWHLANNLGISLYNTRITFDEISKKAVNEAIASPKDINMSLVDAQQARRVIDRLVGYKVSPILSKKIKSGLSGGRVQSAVLKMILDKEDEINKFIPEEYWNISAVINNQSSNSLKANYFGVNDKKEKVADKNRADEIVKDSENASWIVEEVKKSKTNKSPYPPFTTSTLQQDASIKLGMSSSTSMRVAQQLYEGFDISGYGHIALVTYIRTDSVRVSDDFQAQSLNYIRSKFGSEYVPSRPNKYKTKGNAQDAHEAIRPISLDINPADIKDKVLPQQYKLYKLIYDRFLASQMTPAKYDTMNVSVVARSDKDNYIYKISGKSLLFPGYTIVYQEANPSSEEDEMNNLPSLKEGEKFDLEKMYSEQKFTKAPPRYTEATLIKAMEDNGIGRPSTYATVIAVLLKRKYMEKEKRALKPTQLGELVNQFMVNQFKDIVDISFTAKIEDRLDEIEHGLVWQDVLSDFYPKFSKALDNALLTDKVHIEEEVSDVICEKCGSHMVVKEGRYGKFLACPGYPSCKNIKSIIEPVGKCPLCEGDVIKRRTKAGKVFYGCSNYPNCKFVSWKKPAPILCPKCNSTMDIKEGPNSEQYICTKATCKYVITPTKE